MGRNTWRANDCVYGSFQMLQYNLSRLTLYRVRKRSVQAPGPLEGLQRWHGANEGVPVACCIMHMVQRAIRSPCAALRGRQRHSDQKDGACARTCHEAMHMEQRHDQQRPVRRAQLVGCRDVGQRRRQVAVAQRHALGLAGRPAGVQEQRHIARTRRLKCLRLLCNGYHDMSTADV